MQFKLKYKINFYLRENNSSRDTRQTSLCQYRCHCSEKAQQASRDSTEKLLSFQSETFNFDSVQHLLNHIIATCFFIFSSNNRANVCVECHCWLCCAAFMSLLPVNVYCRESGVRGSPGRTF